MSVLNSRMWILLAVFVGAACGPTVVLAADASIPAIQRVAKYPVRATIVDRRRGCPDGYSCYALYGAYGPYGGRAFWGAYSRWYY